MKSKKAEIRTLHLGWRMVRMRRERGSQMSIANLNTMFFYYYYYYCQCDCPNCVKSNSPIDSGLQVMSVTSIIDPTISYNVETDKHLKARLFTRLTLLHQNNNNNNNKTFLSFKISMSREQWVTNAKHWGEHLHELRHEETIQCTFYVNLWSIQK